MFPLFDTIHKRDTHPPSQPARQTPHDGMHTGRAYACCRATKYAFRCCTACNKALNGVIAVLVCVSRDIIAVSVCVSRDIIAVLVCVSRDIIAVLVCVSRDIIAVLVCVSRGIFAHTSQVDVQLDSTMRLISGTLRSTPPPWLPVFSNIEPPAL